jgi:hypothetical protein
MDKTGQAIGGIKSQQKIMRDGIKEHTQTIKAMQHLFAVYREKKEQESRELKNNVFILICINLVFYATLLAIYCVRLYG